jgi:hypothetical protein
MDDGSSPPPLHLPAQSVSTPPRLGGSSDQAASTSVTGKPRTASWQQLAPTRSAADASSAPPATASQAGYAAPAVSSPAQAPARQPSGEAAAGQEAQPGVLPPSNISAEAGTDESVPDSAVDENTLLKGTVQIVADDTEYDQEKNTFLGTGNAVAIIAGQNSRLEADTILYDQNNGTIDARGNVKINRNGQLTTGSSFKFKVNSDEYLITDPDTELQGTTVVARLAKGNRDGLAFKNGSFTLPTPVHIMNNGLYGPLSAAERVYDEKIHPDAYVPQKQSFKFKANKMVYERYKDSGQLTVFGGKLQFDHFTVPLTRFTANVGGENTRVVFPVTPIVGNNMMVGGVNIGPQFNYAVGKTGAFSWAPLVQIGGRSIVSGTTQNNNGSIGAGFKIGYTSDRITTHLAYGSVSNLLVGDFKARINKHSYFQSGINRFLNDGMFGVRRARLLAEVVDQRGITNVPYLSFVGFRTSAGWAQDNPSLVGLSGSQYSQLFNTTGHKKTSAYRVQEQITASTHPIFAVGDTKRGADLTVFGGVALRGYSTGNSMLMAQVGPMLSTHFDRFRARFGYTQSAVRGKSPFVFDQFIQGQRSVFAMGDVKLTKWLTVGTNLGYNLDSQMLYQRSITAAIGPEDFKVMFIRDTISGYQRFGFDVIYGSKVPFNTLAVKGTPDAGQLAGMHSGGI